MKQVIGLALLCLLAVQTQASDPQFRLVGTMPAQKRALAIVEFEGEQFTVREGDTIDGCVIARIDKRQIQLECDDVGRDKHMSYGDRDRYAGFVKGHQVVNVERSKLVSVVQDRQKLVSQISLVPEVSDHRVTGYRVSYLAPGGDLAGMGIQENDLILSVNGAPASEPAGFIRSIDSLAGQSAFSIEVERGDRLVSLDILLD